MRRGVWRDRVIHAPDEESEMTTAASHRDRLHQSRVLLQRSGHEKLGSAEQFPHVVAVPKTLFHLMDLNGSAFGLFDLEIDFFQGCESRIKYVVGNQPCPSFPDGISCCRLHNELSFVGIIFTRLSKGVVWGITHPSSSGRILRAS
ncbi:MAG: hypothetical protein ABSH19_02925 [Opitutales bacterium]|jgi:hypothetical protein